MNIFSYGVESLKTEDGNLLMWYRAVWNASHQNLKGSWAWANRVEPNSTICLCFLSTNPFWWWVQGQECLKMIPERFENSLLKKKMRLKLFGYWERKSRVLEMLNEFYFSTLNPWYQYSSYIYICIYLFIYLNHDYILTNLKLIIIKLTNLQHNAQGACNKI